MIRTPEEIGAKMDALGLWDLLEPYNFAVKPKGSVFPYFCTVLKGERRPVKVRFLMLEGWRTLHDFVRTRVDRNFGIYSSPAELPHLELVVLEDGALKLFRHDTGYLPLEANEPQRQLAARILWEAYGVMLRVESDRTLPMKFSEDKAIFARVEGEKGVWADTPLEIPDPPPYAEKISFSKADLKAAQDLPFVREDVLELDFGILPGVMTKEARPPVRLRAEGGRSEDGRGGDGEPRVDASGGGASRALGVDARTGPEGADPPRKGSGRAEGPLRTRLPVPPSPLSRASLQVVPPRFPDESVVR